MFEEIKEYLVHWYDLRVVGCHEPALHPPIDPGEHLDMSCLVLCKDDKAVYKALAQAYMNGRRAFTIENKTNKPKSHVELIRKGVHKFMKLHKVHMWVDL